MRIELVMDKRTGTLVYRVVVPRDAVLDPIDEQLLKELEKCRSGEINTSSQSQ